MVKIEGSEVCPTQAWMSLERQEVSVAVAVAGEGSKVRTFLPLRGRDLLAPNRDPSPCSGLREADPC